MRDNHLLLTEQAIAALADAGQWLGSPPLPGPYRMVAADRLTDLCIAVLAPGDRIDLIPDCFGVVVSPVAAMPQGYERLSLLHANLTADGLVAAIMTDDLMALAPAIAAWAKPPGLT